MRECPACGASNGETDDFCGNCGNYLGWSDEAAAGRSARVSAEPEADIGTVAAPPASAAGTSPAPATGAEPSGTPGPDRGGDLPDTARTSSSTGPSGAAAPSGAGGPSGSMEAPASGPAPEPAPEPTSRVPRSPGAPVAHTPVTSASPLPPPLPSSPPRPLPVTDASAGAPPKPATPPSTAAPAPASGAGPGPSAPGRPVPPQAPAAPQPVKPGRAVTPRPVVRPVAADEDISGPPCPVCGTPNPPGRRFCRRCAAPLAPAATAAPLPWWRTVWPFRRRTRSGSGRMVRLLIILAVVLALCAAGFLLLPAGRHLFEDTRDKLGKAKAVTPSSVSATAAVPGHPAANTTDGVSNHYWAVPGPGASVTYTFDKPFRLLDVVITNGASRSAEEYAQEGRALRIDAEVTGRDGAIEHKEFSLSDKAGSQTMQVGISEVTRIRLTLEAPAGLTRGHHIALAEVEFFQRA
ncbi:NADase-type glycan-binding domain-containing protein [Streptomyces sp. NPDC102467]|uniref:zinc ribbon domain-containing protein n=1 Tax=Streptomyces sp. NPDC102467 TaxID=3366179 RepID=UPI003806DBD5